MWGFTEQPSTLHDNQLIQSQSEWGKKSVHWHRCESASLVVTHFLSAVKVQRSVLVFVNRTKFSHLQSRMEEQRGTPSPHLFICVYLLVVWIFSSQEGNRHVFKEKRESERERDFASAKWFELGLWVDSQPNQRVVSKVPDMQFPLCQPPEIPLNVSSSLTFSLNHVYWHACEFFRNPTGRHTVLLREEQLWAIVKG